MSIKLTTAGAAVLVAALALGACQKKKVETTNTASATTTESTTTIVAEPVTVTNATPSVTNLESVATNTGYATGAPVTVPEMKPTGDVAQAVRPGQPSKAAAGVAPQMMPTGNEREPYKPAPGK